jgi:hypothetical protein
MDRQNSTPPLTHDLADSPMPRAPLTLERLGEAEQYRELVAAVAAAMDAAVDPGQPHRSTGRTLTISSIVAVANEHPGRVGWAVGALRQLVQSWQGGDVA